jgi:hypothetical protein
MHRLSRASVSVLKLAMWHKCLPYTRGEAEDEKLQFQSFLSIDAVTALELGMSTSMKFHIDISEVAISLSIFIGLENY